MKWFYDKKRGESKEYKKDDLVYIEGTDIKTNRPAKKLDDKRYGPFPVIEKVGTSSYRLKLPISWKRKHPVFHESVLVPYHPPAFPSQKKPPPPPPIAVDEEEEWEVE